MKRISIITGITIVCIATLVVYCTKIWYIDKADTVNVAAMMPAYSLDATTVISLAKNQDTTLKAEEVLEVEGVIKEINTKNDRITILLGTENDNSSCVICDMKADQKQKITKLKPDDTIKLKGVFKGFLEDAIFLNCVISE